jgi:hypothetical protein
VAVYAAVIEDLLGAFRKSHPRRRCECRT